MQYDETGDVLSAWLGSRLGPDEPHSAPGDSGSRVAVPACATGERVVTDGGGPPPSAVLTDDPASEKGCFPFPFERLGKLYSLLS